MRGSPSSDFQDDADVDSRYFAEVMDSARLAGVQRVGLLTTPEAGRRFSSVPGF